MIIKSLLDTDMYKFTMMQAVLHNYPSTWAKYHFKCRNHSETLKQLPNTHAFRDIVNIYIKELSSLQLTPDELEWLSKIRFLKRDFIDFLSRFRLNPNYVKCNIRKGELQIIIEGPWVQTILFEVPILSIVSAIYSKYSRHYNPKLLQNKIQNHLVKERFKFADMGTRRRYSYNEQKRVLQVLKPFPQFVGTSNLHFAKELGLTPIGTMAHEWVQAHQQLTSLENSQQKALDIWAHEYRGDLGIALSDTLGFDKFLKDFDLFFAKLYDGCRHDSGDPLEWTKKLINHYEKLGIDPKTKTAVYSDGLDFSKANNIYNAFHRNINMSFGIGTWLTNDVGITPPQIIIKMVECNGYPVAKISDDPGKGMCEDKNYLKYLTNTIERG